MSDIESTYTAHFGLESLPFENVPDPAFFFGRGGHARVLNHLTIGFGAGRGLMLVTGPIGSGKTTLSQKIMFSFRTSYKLIWMAEPPETGNDYFLLLAHEIGSQIPESRSRSILLQNIRQRLLDYYHEGCRCVVIMDEVHKIADDVIEAVRLTNNLEIGASKLVQTLLLGQDTILERLQQPEWAAFHQRIDLLEVLGRLNPADARKYIVHRLTVAGGHTKIFTRDAIYAIANVSGGIPRVINGLCNRALQSGFDRGNQQVDLDDVREAIRNFGDPEMDQKLFFYLLEKQYAESGATDSRERSADAVQSTEDATAPIESGVARPAVRGKSSASGNPEASPALRDFPRSRSVAPADRSENPDEPAVPEPPGLMVPLLALLGSVILFATSLWFYCDRSGSGIDQCLASLFRF